MDGNVGVEAVGKSQWLPHHEFAFRVRRVVEEQGTDFRFFRGCIISETWEVVGRTGLLCKVARPAKGFDGGFSVAGAEFRVVEGCVCWRENLQVEWGGVDRRSGNLTEGESGGGQKSECFCVHRDFLLIFVAFVD